MNLNNSKPVLYLKSMIYKTFSESLYQKICLLYYALSNRLLYSKSDFFRIVQVETITTCNMKCKYCPNSKFERGSSKNQKLMSTELFHKLVDELAELKFKGIFSHVFYGEPLLDKRLPELIRYTRKKLPLVDMRVYTNGTLLTIDMYKKLRAARVNRFIITQHTQSMLKNIRELFDYRKKHKDSVSIEYRAYDSNSPLYNRGGIIEHPTLRRIRYCNMPLTTIVVDCCGNLVLCCNDYHSSIKFGNLKKEKLINIWNSKFYKKVRHSLKKGIFNLEICKTCAGRIKELKPKSK